MTGVTELPEESPADPPGIVRLTDGLGPVTERVAFEYLMLQLTGRDMDYHARAGTTDVETSWACYLAGVAEERERCAQIAQDHECGGPDDIVCQRLNCGICIAGLIRRA